MGKKTTKKLKVVGTETYINSRTGKVLEMNVVQIRDGDANFQKIWISQILAVVDELSSKKLKFVMYLIEKSSENKNIIPMTVEELAKDSGVGRTTVLETLKALVKADVVKRKRGSIFVNPSFVFKGSYHSRMNVLFQYERVGEEIDEEEQIRLALQEVEALEKKSNELRAKIRKLKGESVEEDKGTANQNEDLPDTEIPPAPY